MHFDKTWSLFLDRDGVINKKQENDYVRSPDQFKFLQGAPEALAMLAQVFNFIFIVTNQQGIGRGLYTKNDLELIHLKMMKHVQDVGGRIDKIYFCPDLAINNSQFRKPNIGMPLEAQKDFPILKFKKSVIVGDSYSDMEMGERLGMYKVFISENKPTQIFYDKHYNSLYSFAVNCSR